ncbi:cyclin-dependent kinase 12 [Biomphalaria pfeifferi]|uniref:Cyclin-dependent kinase 12 n=1 Tax=Biomphalaria pfeifferi TaxID=112525 RepID=A0AAD8BJW4_BIOPF|nr:cyclin-dependent kinase 12 [Biomphalaria pfeifferi]
MVTTMASVQLVKNHQPHHHGHYHPPHHLALLRPASPMSMTLDYSLANTSLSSEGDAQSGSLRDLSPPLSASGSEERDRHSCSETPLKKNKRKLSEPKKRADTVEKSPSPRNIKSGPSDKGSRNKTDLPTIKKTKSRKVINGCAKKSFSWSAAKQSVDRSETTSSSSENETSKNSEGASISQILQPIFHGHSPAALGFIPGLYFPGTPYPHSALQSSFSTLPLQLQHTYLAAAAAQATADSTSPQLSSHAGAMVESDRSLQSKCNPSGPSSSFTSSIAALQPSTAQCASSSKTSASMHDDDDDASSSRAQSPEDLSISGKLSRKHRKNYKNMTRERRVEANARERTRVHTISAAFDALRHAVPSYSHNQKLSKLAILRIACSYIMSLARLADLDYTSSSEHIGTPLTFAQCVDMCTNTIQTEGRARRRH